MAQAIQFTELTLDHVIETVPLDGEDIKLINDLVEHGVQYYILTGFADSEMKWTIFDADSFHRHFEFVGPQFVGKFQDIRRK